ncbi:MAG: HD-GYP domain-containing protein [Chitinivibrionales bacterium]|nr:HD-GYP domain-containing protein [Chitinivibrionales bacterium]
MSGPVKKINIDEVEEGMFIEDVFNDSNVLLLSANVTVTSRGQIEHLKNQGVCSVYINTVKGKDAPPKENESPAVSAGDSQEMAARNRAVSYFEELERARSIHRQTIKTAKDALEAIRLGRDFSVASIEQAAEGIVESIINNPDALISLCQIKGYDEYTYVHSVNVGVLITSLANIMSYSRQRMLEAGMGGILHDIGKMRVPEYILNKPGKFTEAEFNIMKKHPRHGLDIIENKPNIAELSKVVIIQHHERYNGSGYPLGLKAEQIKEIGLISAVADVYDALTSDRIYRAAWTPQKALALIFQGCDKEYHRGIVERFTKHLGIYPVGSFVRLVSGEMGVVVYVDKESLLAPRVLVLFDPTGKRLKDPLEYDLLKLQTENPGEFKIDISLNPKAFQVDVNHYLRDKTALG